jgi:hypothetical protein
VTINTVALQAFYEEHRDAYIAARASNDTTLWDEQYKWDLLPQAGAELAAFGDVTKDNISQFIAVFNKYKSNFAHWIDMDDLSQLEGKPNGYQIIREVWSAAPETVGETIDDANSMAELLLGKHFSPSTFGYILSAKDTEQFSIYRDAFMRNVVKLSDVARPGILTPGKKYQLFNDSINYVGSLMQDDKELFADREWFTSLNGQDLLYVTLQYPADKRK